MRTALIFAVTIAGCAQPSRDPASVLAQARDKLLDRTEHAPNYICVETVNRSYLRTPKSPPASCDEFMGAKKRGQKRELEATDRLRLDVKVSEGTEIGAWAGSRTFDSGSIMDFLGGGPYGTGPMGTLIGDVFGNSGTRFEYHGEEGLNGATVFRYNYQVPLESSHYKIKAGDSWVATAFSGDLWVEPESLDLRRITANSSELPPETQACVADTDVSYERQRIGARDFLLPRESELHFVMRDGTETHSLSEYSQCHEYHAESTLRFDEPSTEDTIAKGAAVAAAQVLPAGLMLRLALQTPIDTNTAAAGDVFTAKVVRGVRGIRGKVATVPAGAIVRGRIVDMHHFFGSSPQFEIGILPQSIEINGVESPFYAVVDHRDDFAAAPKKRDGRGVQILLPPRGRSANVGTFFFQTPEDRFIVPKGQESNWITILPPE